MDYSMFSETNLLNNVLGFCAKNIDKNKVKSRFYIGLFPREYKTSVFGGKSLQKEKDIFSKDKKEKLDKCISFCQKYGLNYEIVETVKSERTVKPFIKQEVCVEVEYLVDNPFNFVRKIFHPQEAIGQPFKEHFQSLAIIDEFVNALYKYYLDNKVNISKPKLGILIDNKCVRVDPRGDLNRPLLELNFEMAGYEDLENEQMRIGMFLTIFEKFSQLIEFEAVWIPYCCHYPQKDDENEFTIFINKPIQEKKLNPWF